TIGLTDLNSAFDALADGTVVRQIIDFEASASTSQPDEGTAIEAAAVLVAGANSLVGLPRPSGRTPPGPAGHAPEPLRTRKGRPDLMVRAADVRRDDRI